MQMQPGARGEHLRQYVLAKNFEDFIGHTLVLERADGGVGSRHIINFIFQILDLRCAFVNGYNVSAMQREEILQSIIEIGVVAIVRVPDAESAIHAMRAVYDGGIRAAEITMTVPGALSVLEKLADQFGDEMVLGAGTVLDAETARACMLAGAQFLVAPSLKLATIEIANRYSRVIFPGALTPTEVLTAWEAGADAIKIFPCGEIGRAHV